MPDNPYSDKIYFPEQIDSFYTLEDNSSSAIEQYQIVYSAHHNKIANLVHTIQPLILTSGTASGDGTLRGLSYTFTLSAALSQIFELFGGPAASSSTLNQPGNTLPFEAVITKSTDTYYHNIGRGYDNILLFKLNNAQDLYNAVAGGLNPFTTYPIIATSLVANSNAGYADGNLDNYIVNAYVVRSSDTFLVRGSIIDVGMGATINQTNSERWLSSGATLNVTLMGVST